MELFLLYIIGWKGLENLFLARAQWEGGKFLQNTFGDFFKAASEYSRAFVKIFLLLGSSPNEKVDLINNGLFWKSYWKLFATQVHMPQARRS